MLLFFIDEQEATDDGGAFTAVSWALISEKQYLEFREDFFSRFAASSFTSSSCNAIQSLPLLHGADLLRELSDPEKLRALRLLLRCFSEHGGTCGRVGYYNNSVPFTKTRVQRVEFCIHNVLLMHPKVSEPFCLLSEMDHRAMSTGFATADAHVNTYHQVLQRVGEGIISIDLRYFVGHFLAMKHALGCQVADISGYIAHKSRVQNTKFSRDLGDVYREFSHVFTFDEVICMNSANGHSS